jgi:nanoRNase/pAp phosphatase (c-di-AMP/oligoRNAs hydrolase)
MNLTESNNLQTLFACKKRKTGMISAEDQASLQKTFQTAQSYLIILRSDPSFDQAASALALTLLLQNAKKQTHLACEKKLPDTFNILHGFELVNENVGNHSLDISFDYNENMVENVSYNIDQENKKFHLIVKPRRGFRSLDPTTVEYSQVGIDADVIFLIGVSSFDQIHHFYLQDESAFTQAHTIALNRQETTFAKTNINTTSYTSICEWLITLIGLWQLTLTSEVATNILAGIEFSTDSFRHLSVTADTFQIVAELMRAGAKRLQLTARLQSSNSSLAQAFSKSQSLTSPLAQAFAQTSPPPAQNPPQQVPSNYSPPAR